MSKPKLTQTELFDILIEEVESIKAAKEDCAKLVKGISEHMGRLEMLVKEPILVYIESMDSAHERIKFTLEKGIYIPKWLAISFLALVLGICMSLFFNYKQYVNRNKQYRYIEWLEGKVGEKLEKDSSKFNPR